jgi:sphinganine-1-phosphate aldolase
VAVTTTERAFPARGVPGMEIERELSTRQLRDLPWRQNSFEVWWPQVPMDVYAVGRRALADFAHTSAFFAWAIPSVKSLEDELAAMLREILNVPESGRVTITLGGTESNFLAVKTARDRARASGRVAGRIVIPRTAHPSLDKAANLMDVEVVRVPVREDFSADVAEIKAALTPETFMVAGSAPSYSFGAIDPISELAELAQEHGLWCHVDACLGGYLLPFLRRSGRSVPDFDFTVPGVDSLSADLHKYGYCPTGISSFFLRDAEMLEFQAFEMEGWPGGRYERVGFPGSRQGNVVAAAWSVLRYLGEDGYIRFAEAVDEVCQRVARGIEGLPAVEVLGSPNYGVVAVGSNDERVTPSRLAATLHERGITLRLNHFPESIHLLGSPLRDMSVVDEFLADMEWAIAELMAGRGSSTGMEAVYSVEFPNAARR